MVCRGDNIWRVDLRVRCLHRLKCTGRLSCCSEQCCTREKRRGRCHGDQRNTMAEYYSADLARLQQSTKQLRHADHSLEPVATHTLYVGTNYQSVWKSFNSGKTWFKVNVGLPSDPANIYFNNDGSPAGGGQGCAGIEARNWAMAIDPTDANVVYTAAGYGCAQGLWKSTNGGATWRQMFSQTLIKQSTNDIGSIDIDPTDHLHILVGTHSAWTGTPGAAGVRESRDGGNTWTLHPLPQAAGSSNHYAAFLNAKTRIVITQDLGIWRTTDSRCNLE